MKVLLDSNEIFHEAEAEGLAKGLAKGSKAKALETAKKLLDRGMEIDEIVDITGLTAEELHDLT